MNIFFTSIQIAVAAIFINNIVFTRFLGLCPFFGVSKSLSSSLGMGFAVTFVMTVSALVIYPIDAMLLVPYKIEFLRTIVFILVIASIVQLVEMIFEKYSPLLHEAMGIYLPLITTNCAILGMSLIGVGKNELTGATFTYAECVINGLMSGIGFLVAIILMASIREKLSIVRIPRAFQGMPITFISAGLIALAFLGFSGITLFR